MQPPAQPARMPYGPAAWLMTDVDDPAGWAAALADRHLDGISDIVPAAETVLVCCDAGVHAHIGHQLDTVRPARRTGSAVAPEPAEVVIEVVYDGADLREVAGIVGLSPAEVVRRHAAADYRVAFCGFSPGFAYLDGLDPRLHVLRRATPRVEVPTGSVAIAAGYSAVYPSPSPGGWHLLGSTAARLWDTDRRRPALLTPRTPVRFQPVER